MEPGRREGVIIGQRGGDVWVLLVIPPVLEGVLRKAVRDPSRGRRGKECRRGERPGAGGVAESRAPLVVHLHRAAVVVDGGGPTGDADPLLGGDVRVVLAGVADLVGREFARRGRVRRVDRRGTGLREVIAGLAAAHRGGGPLAVQHRVGRDVVCALARRALERRQPGGRRRVGDATPVIGSGERRRVDEVVARGGARGGGRVNRDGGRVIGTG